MKNYTWHITCAMNPQRNKTTVIREYTRRRRMCSSSQKSVKSKNLKYGIKFSLCNWRSFYLFLSFLKATSIFHLSQLFQEKKMHWTLVLLCVGTSGLIPSTGFFELTEISSNREKQITTISTEPQLPITNLSCRPAVQMQNKAYNSLFPDELWWYICNLTSPGLVIFLQLLTHCLKILYR